jgi:hypothetical protein
MCVLGDLLLTTLLVVHLLVPLFVFALHHHVMFVVFRLVGQLLPYAAVLFFSPIQGYSWLFFSSVRSIVSCVVIVPLLQQW